MNSRAGMKARRRVERTPIDFLICSSATLSLVLKTERETRGSGGI